MIDPGWRAFYEAHGWPLERWLGYGIELHDAVIDVGRPRSALICVAATSSAAGWCPAGTTRSPAPVFGGVKAGRLLLEEGTRG
jgi:hypothetical protein